MTVEIGWVSEMSGRENDQVTIYVTLHDEPRQRISFKVSMQNARKFWIGQIINAQATENSK